MVFIIMSPVIHRPLPNLGRIEVTIEGTYVLGDFLSGAVVES